MGGGGGGGNQGQSINANIADTAKSIWYLTNPDKAFGRKPNVPDFPSLTGIMQNMVGANQAIMPDLTKMAGTINTYNMGAYQTKYEALRSQVADWFPNWQSALKGEVPADVSAQVQNSAAARAVGGGYGGTGLNRNLVARDLGLTSLAIQQQAQNSLAQWFARAGVPETFRLESGMATSGDAMAQAATKWQRDWLSEQIAASPDPKFIGTVETWGTLAESSMNAVESIFKSIYGGGGMGG